MTQKLNEQLRESLSALVDAEAGELEMRRVLKNAEEDSEVRETWRRYQIASALMRKETQIDLSTDLSERIRASIDGEQSYDDGVEKSASEDREAPLSSVVEGRSFRDFIAKSSIAASVAIAIVAGVQFGGLSGNGEAVDGGSQLAGVVDQLVEPAQIQKGGVNMAPAGFDLPPLVSRNASSEVVAGPSGSANVSMQSLPAYVSNAELQAELDYLIQQHAERSSAQGGLGMLPFARISRLQKTTEASQ